MHLGVVMCVRVNDGDLETKTVSLYVAIVSILRTRNDAETILKS